MINLREIILGALMDIVEEEQYSHIVLKDVLEKYQYLDKRDRAFITRVTEGTLENMLQMDYIIERFSKVKVENMKPVIRNILRMSVYQLKYMDSVPDSAVCNEGVRLAQKRGFYQLKRFCERRSSKCCKKSGQSGISFKRKTAVALSFSHLFHAGMDCKELV